MAKHLTSEDRIKIETILGAGISADNITKQLGRHRSTIFKEKQRSGI